LTTPSKNWHSANAPFTVIKTEIDDHSLFIWERLKQEHVAWGERTSDGITLSSVFFHEVMQILSSYVYRVLELRHRVYLEELQDVERRTFPYADFRDVRSGAAAEKDPLVAKRDRVKWAKETAARLESVIRGGRVPIAVARSLSIDRSELAREFSAHGFSIRYVTRSGVFVEKAEEQMAGIADVSRELFERLDAPELAPSVTRLLDQHIRFHLAARPDPFTYDALITGSLCNLPARKVAVAAHRAGKPVIAVFHGEAWGVLNEPNHGYGESAFASDIVINGSTGGTLESPLYEKSLTGNPTYWAADSPLLTRIWDGGTDVSPASVILDGTSSGMYVPTILSGFETYGPFRSIPDRQYKEWFRHVLSLDSTMKIKPYLTGLELGDIPQERILTGNFIHLRDEPDYFVFDYVSTAFTVAASTNKPILFLDLGINNLTERGIRFIEERCVRIQVTDDLNRDAILEAIRNASGKSREGLAKFTMSPDGVATTACLRRVLNSYGLPG